MCVQDPPEGREEYDAFVLGYEAAKGRRAPLQLSAPRSGRTPREAFVADQRMDALAVPAMTRR